MFAFIYNLMEKYNNFRQSENNENNIQNNMGKCSGKRYLRIYGKYIENLKKYIGLYIEKGLKFIVRKSIICCGQS